jgi:adenylate kinase family enzyme
MAGGDQRSRGLRRVAVLGTPGAGKSTFAVALGRAIDAPVFHLDAIHWKPGWVEADRDEFRARQRELLGLERWVLDGNYSSRGLAERLARADVAVVLAVTRRSALWRVVRRSLRHRGTTRPDLGSGNPERVSVEFLRWVWNWCAPTPTSPRPSAARRAAHRSSWSGVARRRSASSRARAAERRTASTVGPA